MTNRQTNRSTIRPTNQLTNRPGHREVTLPIMIKNTFQNENYHYSVVSRVENVLMSHDGWANGWMYNWYGARLSQIGGNFKSFNNYNK